MKITKYFWYSFVIMIILNIIPYILTMSAPGRDGVAIIGFPISFYSYGGLFPNVFPYASSNFFSWEFLLIDLIVLVVVPLIVNYWFSRKKNS